MPDVWERLPHFQDNIAKILLSPEDLVFDPRAMKFAFEMTEEDYTSSEHQDSDEIWLDDEESLESEPEVSKNATRWDSFEDLVGEDGDATDLSATVGQTETEDDQAGEDQQSTGPSLIPSKHDSDPSLVSISSSQATIEQSSKHCSYAYAVKMQAQKRLRCYPIIFQVNSHESFEMTNTQGYNSPLEESFACISLIWQTKSQDVVD